MALALWALGTAVPLRASGATAGKPRSTYVIVHGAAGGGWDWRIVADRLTADGHLVFRPTLTGLGERTHLLSPEINLTTHITDIVNVILFEDLHDVVLVGHSYGGMVITGVINRIPERISHVIYLDAAVPDDGQSALDLWGPLSADIKVVDGIAYFPWIDASKPYPRDVPQSLKTVTEPVVFNNPAARRIPATYVAFVPAGQHAEERAKSDPSWLHAKARGWTIRILESNHVAERTHPQELAVLLEEAPADRNAPATAAH